MAQITSDQVSGLIDEARGAFTRFAELRDEVQAAGDDATAEQKASRNEAQDAALEAKATADGLVEDFERQQKAEDLSEWMNGSAGLLPAMGGAQSTEAKAGVSASVEYKATSGEVKSYTPRGVRHFSAEDEVQYTNVFRSFLLGGVNALNQDEMKLAEKKALLVGSDTAGGFLVMNEVMINELVQALEDAVFMRRVGRVLPPLTSATAISVATASDLDAAEWTSELATGSNDTAAPFGKRSLRPHPIAKRVKISNTHLRLSTMDGEAWVRDEGANRIAAAEENAFLNGSGAQQPEGLFNSNLLSVVTAASATAIAYDDIVEVEFSLKSQYRPGAEWILHRTIFKELMLLKDGNDLPLFRRIPGAGARFDLMSYPVNESEYSPNSSATGLDVAALGNWRRSYWIQDTLNSQVQRLVELYAETNETGFIFRRETDGMIVDGNGAVKLQMA